MVEGEDHADAQSLGQTGRDLLIKIREGFDSLMAAVQPLDDQAIMATESEGQWSVKDNLAHIAAWEEILLRFHIGGEPFESAVGQDGVSYRVTPYDVINEHLHQRDRTLGVSDVMNKLRLGHEAVVREVGRLTDEELARSRPWLDTPESPSGPLSQYIAWNTYEHYAEHLATINSLADKK
jgi:hypothetical protein